VERDHGPPAEGAASFHTTRWTIVMQAAQSQAQGGQSALAELCRLYWYPLGTPPCCGRRSGARCGIRPRFTLCATLWLHPKDGWAHE
jgi:hypothetical protein